MKMIASYLNVISQENLPVKPVNNFVVYPVMLLSLHVNQDFLLFGFSVWVLGVFS